MLLAKRANATSAATDDPSSSSSADPTSATTTPTVKDVKAAHLPPYELAATVPKLSPAPNVVITSSSVCVTARGETITSVIAKRVKQV